MWVIIRLLNIKKNDFVLIASNIVAVSSDISMDHQHAVEEVAKGATRTKNFTTWGQEKYVELSPSRWKTTPNYICA